MSWIKGFRTDYRPEVTKFVTLYLMPLWIIFLVYVSLKSYNLYQRGLQSFIKHEVAIDRMTFVQRSNNKFKETIYTDLVIYPSRLNINFISTELKESDENILLTKLKPGDKVIIYQNEESSGLYGSGFFDIVQLEKQNEILIALYEKKNDWKLGSRIGGGAAVLFLLWYLSRIFRYKKYGRI